MIYKVLGCLSVILCDINVRCNYFLTNEIKNTEMTHVFSAAQLLSCVRVFVTLWAAVLQASLSITNSPSLLKLMSIESVMPSNHHILCRPLHLPPSIISSIESFPMSQFFSSGGQSTGVSALASVLPMNIQD